MTGKKENKCVNVEVNCVFNMLACKTFVQVFGQNYCFIVLIVLINNPIIGIWPNVSLMLVQDEKSGTSQTSLGSYRQHE